MPATMAHYAVAAVTLRAVGFRRRELALASAWAIVPDLDVITAVPWMLAAPSLPLSADTLVTGAYLFGHRGLSHTFLAALLAMGVAWWWTGSRRWTAAAGLAWGGHVILDALSTWPIQPFWPLSTVEFQLPLVAGLDPLLNVFSTIVLVVFLGPILARRIERIDGDWIDALETFGHRREGALLAGVLASLVLAAGTVVAVGGGIAPDEAFPANAPRTATVVPSADAETDGWNVTTRWVPWTDGDTRRVAFVEDRTNGTHREELDAARCVLDDLGPYATVDHPVWRITKASDGTVVGAQDLVRNATRTGGPWTWFRVQNQTVQEAWVTGSDGRQSWVIASIPQPVVEAATCP